MVCPPYQVGDVVEIVGSWKMASPHSERNSDGLLVFKKMKNITQNWETPPLDPTAVPPAGRALRRASACRRRTSSIRRRRLTPGGHAA